MKYHVDGGLWVLTLEDDFKEEKGMGFGMEVMSFVDVDWLFFSLMWLADGDKWG